MHAEFIFLFLLFSFCTVHVVHTDQDGYVHSCETQAVAFVYLSGSVVKISCGMTLMSFPR